jgi:hypothetical protein
MANTSLPLQLPWDKSSTLWASQINPVLGNEIVNGLILENVQLISGTNTINHKLGRRLQGWYITRQRGAGSFYDQQDTNQMQDLTLILNSSTTVSVNIAVF